MRFYFLLCTLLLACTPALMAQIEDLQPDCDLEWSHTTHWPYQQVDQPDPQFKQQWEQAIESSLLRETQLENLNEVVRRFQLASLSVYGGSSPESMPVGPESILPDQEEAINTRVAQQRLVSALDIIQEWLDQHNWPAAAFRTSAAEIQYADHEWDQLRRLAGLAPAEGTQGYEAIFKLLRQYNQQQLPEGASNNILKVIQQAKQSVRLEWCLVQRQEAEGGEELQVDAESEGNNELQVDAEPAARPFNPVLQKLQEVLRQEVENSSRIIASDSNQAKLGVESSETSNDPDLTPLPATAEPSEKATPETPPTKTPSKIKAFKPQETSQEKVPRLKQETEWQGNPQLNRDYLRILKDRTHHTEFEVEAVERSNEESERMLRVRTRYWLAARWSLSAEGEDWSYRHNDPLSPVSSRGQSPSAQVGLHWESVQTLRVDGWWLTTPWQDGLRLQVREFFQPWTLTANLHLEAPWQDTILARKLEGVMQRKSLSASRSFMQGRYGLSLTTQQSLYSLKEEDAYHTYEEAHTLVATRSWFGQTTYSVSGILERGVVTQTATPIEFTDRLNRALLLRVERVFIYKWLTAFEHTYQYRTISENFADSSRLILEWERNRHERYTLVLVTGSTDELLGQTVEKRAIFTARVNY